MPPELKERLQHPPPQHERKRVGVQQAPDNLQPPPSGEVRTRQLVDKAEANSQIRKQMQEVPLLIGDAPPHTPQ
jgi:hypothetical protein